MPIRQHSSREADGGYVVTFRDLPEAVAQGDDLDQALRCGMYSLAVALEFRIRDDEGWPEPSPSARASG